jgi:hypothetical protein
MTKEPITKDDGKYAYRGDPFTPLSIRRIDGKGVYPVVALNDNNCVSYHLADGTWAASWTRAYDLVPLQQKPMDTDE